MTMPPEVRARLRAHFAGRLPGRLEELERAELAYRADPDDPEAERTLRRVAHNVHGTAASFGFPELSEAGRDAELASADQLLPMMATLAQRIRATIEREHEADESSS